MLKNRWDFPPVFLIFSLLQPQLFCCKELSKEKERAIIIGNAIIGEKGGVI